MQTPVQIDFQGMPARPELRTEIERHVAELETRFGRITACRIALRAPGGHHRTGGLYDVNIRIALPNGREVNVDRTPQNDERHSDLAYAVNDAFKRARRQLQDQARRMEGQVKQHEEQPIGTVTKLAPDGEFGFFETPDGEFGFFETPDGREVYFHRNSVLNGAFDRLTVGARVHFAEEMGDKGPQASTVKPLGKHGLRP